MEFPIRHLTEDRIRELLSLLPAFDASVRRHGRTKRGRKPVPLPAPSQYPSVASLADIVAPYYSDKEEDVNLFRDMMRLQELWGYAQAIPSLARAGIEATIANLRAQAPQLIADAGSAERIGLITKLIAARAAYLESFTGEEFAAIERCAPEIESAFRRRLEAHIEAKRRESERRKLARQKRREADRSPPDTSS